MKFKRKNKKKKDNSYWKLIKEITGIWLKPIPFSCSVVVIFLVQLCIANNWLDNHIGKYYGFGILVALLVAAVGIDWIGNTRILDFRRINEITPLDTFLYVTSVTTFFNLILLGLHWGITPLIIMIIFGVFFVVIGSGLFKRLHQIHKAHENKQDNDSQSKNTNNSLTGLIDLHDLYEEPVEWQKGDGAIVIDEHAVDYDLFNRDATLDQLVDAINHSSQEHSYVVGLVGDWGSGKTTLLNNLKNEYDSNEDYVFIHAPGNNEEDFDLWLFGSKDEIIRGLYETFLDNIGVKYSSFKVNRMLENISKVVAGIPNSGSIIGPLIGETDPYSSVLLMKKRLSEYIKSTHKHYVMCIENLDRASDDQIILFLKLINTIFDFPNVTYVLLYDNTRINRILKDGKIINESFKEKVINQEVKIPLLIDTNVSIKCMQNLLLSYGLQNDDLNEFDIVLETIAQNLLSIRELKTIMNSAFAIFTHKDKIRLNYPQLLAMQYLFYSEPKLYKTLKDNKDWLIVKDTGELTEIERPVTDVLKRITSTYSKYKNLLEALFPKIEVADNDGRIFRSNTDWREAIKDKVIFIPECFNNYFMLNEDEYIKVNNLLNEFVKEVNVANIGNLSKIWNKYILSQTDEMIDQIEKQIYPFITIEDIPSSKKREKLSEIIFQSVMNGKSKIDEYTAADYIGIFVGETKKEDFEKFKAFVLNKYGAIDFIKKISNYMNKYKQESGITSKFLENGPRIRNLYVGMRDKILRSGSNINLYNKKYYRKFISFGLILEEDGVKSEVDNKEVSEYIAKCVNSNTIYNILEDAKDYTGEGNKDVISEPFADALNDSKDKIEKIFKENPPKTDRGKELEKLYYKFEQASY